MDVVLTTCSVSDRPIAFQLAHEQELRLQSSLIPSSSVAINPADVHIDIPNSILSYHEVNRSQHKSDMAV